MIRFYAAKVMLAIGAMLLAIGEAFTNASEWIVLEARCLLYRVLDERR